MVALDLALGLARMAMAQALRRLGVTLGLWALCFLFALIGVLALSLAGFIALAEAWGPLPAALVIGLGGLTLALACFIAARGRRVLPDVLGPQTAELRAAFAAATDAPKADTQVWLPLLGLALLGFLLGSGRKG